MYTLLYTIIHTHTHARTHTHIPYFIRNLYPHFAIDYSVDIARIHCTANFLRIQLSCYVRALRVHFTNGRPRKTDRTWIDFTTHAAFDVMNIHALLLRRCSPLSFRGYLKSQILTVTQRISVFFVVKYSRYFVYSRYTRE